MTVELGLLCVLISGIIGWVTFYVGRQTAARKSGVEWGELRGDIRHIKRDLDDIKGDLKESNRDLRNELRSATKRLHERIDQHEQKWHGKMPNEDDT